VNVHFVFSWEAVEVEIAVSEVLAVFAVFCPNIGQSVGDGKPGGPWATSGVNATVPSTTPRTHLRARAVFLASCSFLAPIVLICICIISLVGSQIPSVTIMPETERKMTLRQIGHVCYIPLRVTAEVPSRK
jgi:hypothetical protein